MKNIFFILLFIYMMLPSTFCLADENLPFVVKLPTKSKALEKNDFRRIVLYVKKTFPQIENAPSLHARIDQLSYERKTLLLTAFSHLIPDNADKDIIFDYEVETKSITTSSGKKIGTVIANFYYLTSDGKRLYNVQVVKK